MSSTFSQVFEKIFCCDPSKMQKPPAAAVSGRLKKNYLPGEGGEGSYQTPEKMEGRDSVEELTTGHPLLSKLTDS